MIEVKENKHYWRDCKQKIRPSWRTEVAALKKFNVDFGLRN